MNGLRHTVSKPLFTHFVPYLAIVLAMALFDHINLVYGTVSEFCTPSGCPDMTGPGQR